MSNLTAFPELVLISHPLCPYVQRAVIALAEKNVPFKRRDIDLLNKPDWFLQISPLGKTPVLRIDGHSIFESAVILEYLEETLPNPLHPGTPLKRAEHRSWIEFGSVILSDIAGLYNAKNKEMFTEKFNQIRRRFERLEHQKVSGRFFDGEHFSLVDAAFGPVFRYFDVFEKIREFDVLSDLEKVRSWRDELSARPSVQSAVSGAYPELLRQFLFNRNSYISEVLP